MSQSINVVAELRPHTGKKNTPLGVIDVEHDQWIVVASVAGRPLRQVGYLPKREGAPLLLLAGIEEQCGAFITQAIREAVAAKRQEMPSE